MLGVLELATVQLVAMVVTHPLLELQRLLQSAAAAAVATHLQMQQVVVLVAAVEFLAVPVV